MILDLFKRRRAAYRSVFNADSVPVKIVLADLAQFCRASGSTIATSAIAGKVDPFASAALAGRREVWIRISQLLHLSDRDIIKIMENEREQQQEATING